MDPLVKYYLRQAGGGRGGTESVPSIFLLLSYGADME
jgi:hypothetical protein